MSDIIIPGFSNNSGIDTNRAIEDLLELERIPITRLETSVEQYELQREAWQDLGRNMTNLGQAAATLTGFESPFRDRVADSSDPAILTAGATRVAEENTESITVLQTAGRDRFASNAVTRDFDVPAGTYGFSLGERTEEFRFGGGSLERFADEVNLRAGNLVRATVVPNTATTQVVIFEGQEEGADQPLGFTESSSGLVRELGVLGDRPERGGLALFTDDALSLGPGQSRDETTAPLEVAAGMVLRFQARVRELDTPAQPEIPPGPTPLGNGTASFGGVTIQNEAIDLPIPQPQRPEVPPVVQDNRVITVSGGGREIALPELPLGDAFQPVEVSASQLPAVVEALTFTNRNTARTVEIRDLQLTDPAARKDGVATNALDSARDARIVYNGIEVERRTNTIDDLIPGVTLNLHRRSQDPVTIEIAPDRESTKAALIEFVGHYNRVIADLNVYTRNAPAIVDQLTYLSESEEETARERLGLFQGDSGLNTLRRRMQTIMMNEYDPGPDGGYRLLAELGISTNARGAGNGTDAERLRGYLEISETVLDEALATDFEAVERLLGRDSDGDLVRDTGVAITLERFVDPFVGTGGVVQSRSSGLDTRISRTEERIETLSERLEDYETRLRIDFGRMEGALQQLKESGSAFDNLGQRNRD